MNFSHWMRRSIVLLSALALSTTLLTGCGDDDDDDDGGPGPGSGDATVTAEMAGIWSFTVTIKDCVSGTTLFSTTDADTLCVGERLDEAVGGDDANCTLTKNGNSFHLECDTSETIEGCTSTTHVVVDMTYTNTTVTADGQASFSDSPEGCAGGSGSFCVAIRGQRTGNVPSGACN
ncbi:MAG: hypothetical protein IPK72_09040 [Candidatus Eisenbacteria bacterium]|nr:hypothetical protein [Candidatus Eisenbacteria bacterium]